MQAMLDTIEQHAKHYLPGPIDPAVMMALQKTPRELFGGDYQDHPCPIGFQQTISQPFMVAMMSAMIYRLSTQHEHVLEIGSGSGYQSAVLAQLYAQVTGIERIEALAVASIISIQALALHNINIIHQNAFYPVKNQAKFDAILVACGVYAQLPPVWVEQLSEQGVLLVPFAESANDSMQLCVWQKQQGQLQPLATGLSQPLYCNFVPFINP